MALANYEEVKDRLPRFLNDENRTRPRIITRLVTDPNTLATEAGFIAELWDGDELLATGHAYELRLDGNSRQVNATSWVENCETSAIGRALANGGYASGDKRPSREEMEKVERMQAESIALDDAKQLISIAKSKGTVEALKKHLNGASSAKAVAAILGAMSDTERQMTQAVAEGTVEP